MADHVEKSGDDRFLPVTSISEGKEREVQQDVFLYTNQVVNVVCVGRPEDENWVLIDAGMPKSGDRILRVVEERYGVGNKPTAILLTHGHFDHVGGLIELIKQWNVPVYAHPLEFPFLTGEKSYPEPDSSVEGGLLAKAAFVYPHGPVDISPVLKKLPEDHTVPGLPQWEWIHTRGHSPGHVSFFRDQDKTLIAGDAFITVKQDSLYKVLVQKKEICGPPRYLTTDWRAAQKSVERLEALRPQVAVTGHGTPMEGENLRRGLLKLVKEFEKVAIPDHGRYVDDH